MKQHIQALRIKQVTAKVGRSKTSIYADIRQGTFPAPAYAGHLAIWNEAEVDAWLAERFAERDTRLRK